MASEKVQLAKAYVQIVPSARGISGAISKEMGSEATSAGRSAGLNIAGAIKGAIVAAGIGTAIKNAINEGAALQQSIGGIETLFKGSADTVRAYADEAYKSAGLSANAYMEQVTSFSASLLQSLGGDTAKAAEAANAAIIAMADNSNKMGTDIQAIQNAYQGFAKQNYTMLDNLKLGYGGTKTEMERLLKDAEKLTGYKYDISSLSDVYNAIHVIQDELGITGTTALEAEKTFTGSFAAMRSAAQNLLGALALGEDIKPSLEALFSTAKTFLLDNLLPMIANIIRSGIRGILGEDGDLLLGLFDKLGEALQWIGEKAGEFFAWLREGTPAAQAFKAAVIALTTAFIGYKTVMTAMSIIKDVAEAQKNLNLAMSANPIGAVIVVVAALAAGFAYLWSTSEGFRNFFIGLGKDLKTFFTETLPDGVQGAIDFLASLPEKAFQWGADLIKSFIDGIKSFFTGLADTVKDAAGVVKDFLGFSEPDKGPLSNFHTFAPDMMRLFAQGIRHNESLITDQIASSFDVGAQIIDYGMAPRGNQFQPVQTGVMDVFEDDTPPIVIDLTLMTDGVVTARRQINYTDEVEAMRGVSMLG